MVTNKPGSPLLRLPGELRNKVYSFAVGGFVIMVSNKGSRSSIFRPNEPVKLTYRLAIATTHGTIEQSENNTNASGSCLEAGPSPGVEHVSSIFTIARVCRQVSEETALLQYKENVFSFSTELVLLSFSAMLKSAQRNAINTIPIETEYVEDTVCHRSVYSFLGMSTPMPPFREILPSLNSIFVAPRSLQSVDGETNEQKFFRVHDILDLNAECDIGLLFRCYDVLDATADLKGSCSVKVISLGGHDEEPSDPEGAKESRIIKDASEEA